jgi:hypothetical protein
LQTAPHQTPVRRGNISHGSTHQSHKADHLQTKAKLDQARELVDALEKSEESSNKEKKEALHRQMTLQRLLQSLDRAANITADKVRKICAGKQGYHAVS